MLQKDKINLVVSGMKISGFTGVNIDMAIDHIADGFALSMPWNPENVEQKELFKPFKMQKTQLFIGNDLLLTGQIDKISPSLSGGQRVLTIEGRSRTAQLADCSIDGDLEFSGLTAYQIASKICRPFGIAVQDSSRIGVIDNARATYGQNAADFINGITSARNCVLGCSYTGNLIMQSGDLFATRAPSATIKEGKFPFLGISAGFNSTHLGSIFKVASQNAGAENITGKAVDSSVSLHRPMLSVASDTDSNPSLTASRMRGNSYAKAIDISCTLSGWRLPDGSRWAERKVIMLKSDSAMIYKTSPFLVSGVRMSLDASGRTTTLRLVPIETYSGKKPKTEIWGG